MGGGMGRSDGIGGGRQSEEDEQADVDVDGAVAEWVKSTGFPSLPFRCSLFARKFGDAPAGTRGSEQSHIYDGAMTGHKAHGSEIGSEKYDRVGQESERHQRESEVAVLRWALSCDGGLGLGRWCAERRVKLEEAVWGL